MRQLETSSVNNEMNSFDIWSYVFIDPVWIHVTLNCYISIGSRKFPQVSFYYKALSHLNWREKFILIYSCKAINNFCSHFLTDIIYIKLQSLIRIYYVNVSILSTNQRVPGWTQLAGAAQNVKCICQIWLTST